MHLAVVAELGKGQFPPQNPYFAGVELHYYWLYFLYPALGHKLEVKEPRTSTFGYGQAVVYDRKSGVKFGASDPRHDGEAIPAGVPFH